MSEQKYNAARPIVLVALSFWAGVLLVANGWVPSLLKLLVLAGGILLIWIQFPFARRFDHVPLVLLFIIAGAVSWWTRHAEPPGDAVQRLVIKQPEDARYIIRGKVERPDVLLSGDEYMQFQLRVREIEVDGSLYQVDGGVLVRWSEPNRALVHGEEVTIEAGMLPTIQRINQGVHGIEEYYRLQGIHSSVRIRGPGVVGHFSQSPFWSVRGWASRLRQDLAERLVESGTAHILAVSGVQQVYRTDYGGRASEYHEKTVNSRFRARAR